MKENIMRNPGKHLIVHLYRNQEIGKLDNSSL